jgi:hypothetical protein
MYSLLEECALNEGAKTLDKLKANLELIAQCAQIHLDRASVCGGYIQNNSLQSLNELNTLIENLINNKGK